MHVAFVVVCRVRAWPVPVLIALDVAAMAGIGIAFSAIVLHHPSPVVAVLEGLLALSAVLSIRALLVPSSVRRTALVGTLLCAGTAVVLLVHREHFSVGPISLSTLLSVFFTWAGIVVGFTSFASSELYGLRREVQRARKYGQYTLLEKLGEGGMGVVYRAQHAMLRRPTAIKLLNEAHQKEAYLTRFEREVQLMAELTHPNTVTVHDYGRTADGVFYYAMEYLDGVDLELLVSACGAQDPARVIHILRQVCGALGEAHGRGLIHRDVKPANVFLCRARGEHDVVKVLDFGLVKEVLPDADPTNTGEQSFLGTPVYMSPESISSSRELDGRSDLYSLGAVGYFLLCGERVFDGASTVQICAQHLYTAPVPPSERTDHPVPKDLEALLLACLAKKPEERPASAAALSAALAACADAGKWDDTRARTWWTERGPAIAARRASRKGEATVAHQQTIAVER